jgi:hypothetical protein
MITAEGCAEQPAWKSALMVELPVDRFDALLDAAFPAEAAA